MGDGDVTITGSWTFTEAPKYGVSYDWGTDAPAGKTVPKDTGSYYAGDKYTVDTTYKAGDIVAGKKEGKKGTWTFSGWTDPKNGTMGDGDVTITGSWTFTEAPKYGVSYDWGADAPAGKTVPKDTGSYYAGDTYTLDTTYKANDTVEGEKDGKKGTWTFSGWTDSNNGTMGDKGVTITGSWTFTEAPKYGVSYDWGADAPAGKTVPKDTGSYYAGDSYTLDTTYKANDTVEGEKDGKKGTWTFSGWTDPNNGTMGDKGVTITGSWTFTEAPKYGVSYDWGADAPAGKTVPKDTGSYYAGDSYTLDTTYKANDTVEGEKDGKKGTWTFSGWTDPNNGTMGDGDATITGSWTFTEAPVNPPDPTNPTDPTKPTNRGGNVGNAPGTGDNRNLALWTSLMALAGMGVAGVTSYGRRKRQN